MSAASRRTVETAPDHVDPRLRGRTYAIPFEQVWQATVAVAGGLHGWKVVQSDDYDGIIHAEARTLVRGRIYDVNIRISLDENAQTRVDLTSVGRTGFFDWGGNARRVARFCRKLDDRLAKGRAKK